MKPSEFRQLIREEIQNVLSEAAAKLGDGTPVASLKSNDKVVYTKEAKIDILKTPNRAILRPGLKDNVNKPLIYVGPADLDGWVKVTTGDIYTVEAKNLKKK